MDWVSAMDIASASGVIDYDAPAYLLGLPPRYMGRANLNCLPNVNLEYLAYQKDFISPNQPKIQSQQPIKDTLQLNTDKENELIQNPKWKKNLFYGILGLTGVAGLIMLLKKLLHK